MPAKTLRNLLVILTLAIGLAFLLFLQPWKSNKSPDARITDRLPKAHLIGSAQLLDLSKSLSSTMFYYRLPFRDFLTPEFILSQGKNYGVDVQSPVYFFLNEKNKELDDWGIFLHVRDSSKILEGINHLQKFIDIQKTTFKKNQVYKYAHDEIYLCYGKDWLFLYGGLNQREQLIHAMEAKLNEIDPSWRSFLNNELTGSKLNATCTHQFLEGNGIERLNISLDNDSTSLSFKTALIPNDTLPFNILQSGPSFISQDFTKRLVNLHIDTTNLNLKNSSIYAHLKEWGSKVAFPVDQFLESWTGHIAFRQGGFEKIKERYIESELDENFNVNEVVKYRTVKVSGYSLYLSVNSKGRLFEKKLFEKGILTKDDNKVRFLFSPPLHLNKNDTSMVLHTNRYIPNSIDSTNFGFWTINRTPVGFSLDSTSQNTLFGTVNISLERLVDKYIE